jgi:hypothetical protein
VRSRSPLNRTLGERDGRPRTHRPEPVTLASLTQELLAGGAVAPA